MKYRTRKLKPEKVSIDLTNIEPVSYSDIRRLVYKFRIYPNKKQHAKLTTILDALRRLYNSALARRQRLWEKDKTKVNSKDEHRIRDMFKENIPELKSAPAISIEDVFRRLDKVYRRFYRKQSGYPKPKDFWEYNSFYIYVPSNRKFKIRNGKIRLTKIGDIRIKVHRPLVGEQTSLIVKKEGPKWFVCICVKPEKPEQVMRTNEAVGLKFDVEDIVTTSTGKKLKNPRFYWSAKKRLKKYQRKMARQQNGSANWLKTRLKWEDLMNKTRNQRDNYLHEISMQLVKDYDLLAVQTQSLKKHMKKMVVKKNEPAVSMQKAALEILSGTRKKYKWNIARYAYLDAGVAKLQHYLKYKSQLYGKIFIEIDEPWCLWDCSECSGHRKVEMIDQNAVECPTCGAIMDTKTNMAKNILAGALYKVRPHPSC